jgi:hypothetical protein
VLKKEHLNIDHNFDHQMSLSKSKWYSNNCLQFLKQAVPFPGPECHNYPYFSIISRLIFSLLTSAQRGCLRMAPNDVPQMFFVISMMLLNVFSGNQLGPVQATVLTMFSPPLKKMSFHYFFGERPKNYWFGFSQPFVNLKCSLKLNLPLFKI